MAEELPYAETLNYWKTSKVSPQAWLDKAESLIEEFGGTVHVVAKGKQADRTAYMIEFSFPPDQYRAIWPVLPTKGKDTLAAERQAATMLFHDLKARAMRVAVMGPRTTFIDYLMLESGETVAQVSNAQLSSALPTALLPPGR